MTNITTLEHFFLNEAKTASRHLFYNSRDFDEIHNLDNMSFFKKNPVFFQNVYKKAKNSIFDYFLF